MFAVAFLATSSLLGCGSPESKLVGKWYAEGYKEAVLSFYDDGAYTFQDSGPNPADGGKFGWASQGNDGTYEVKDAGVIWFDGYYPWWQVDGRKEAKFTLSRDDEHGQKLTVTNGDGVRDAYFSEAWRSQTGEDGDSDASAAPAEEWYRFDGESRATPKNGIDPYKAIVGTWSNGTDTSRFPGDSEYEIGNVDDGWYLHVWDKGEPKEGLAGSGMSLEFLDKDTIVLSGDRIYHRQ